MWPHQQPVVCDSMPPTVPIALLENRLGRQLELHHQRQHLSARKKGVLVETLSYDHLTCTWFNAPIRGPARTHSSRRLSLCGCSLYIHSTKRKHMPKEAHSHISGDTSRLHSLSSEEAPLKLCLAISNRHECWRSAGILPDLHPLVMRKNHVEDPYQLQHLLALDLPPPDLLPLPPVALGAWQG